ncbi:uncharacterized protein LOC124160790 [Ischnura elegans]|uniref:uncharacterized protein LOC124160790 n=1 Tax=Ischnura elegans TaxID=197161 RepID=UPI001ED8A048|nr:uncharacterized protein LOC124160790 [Ischnura elegans]
MLICLNLLHLYFFVFFLIFKNRFISRFIHLFAMRLLFELGCYIFRKKSRVGRATDRQLKLLVDYMSTHSSFAAGKFTGPLGYEKSQGQWQNLANMLNEQGGYKEAEQWKKTWRDLKRNIRAKAARINAACRETGNRPVRETLSEMEEKCLSIFGSEVAVGLPGRDHCDGIPGPSQIAITTDDTSQQSEASRAPGEGTSITVEEHLPAAVDHMEIIVEDLFHKEEPGTAGRRKFFTVSNCHLTFKKLVYELQLVY